MASDGRALALLYVQVLTVGNYFVASNPIHPKDASSSVISTGRGAEPSGWTFQMKEPCRISAVSTHEDLSFRRKPWQSASNIWTCYKFRKYVGEATSLSGYAFSQNANGRRYFLAVSPTSGRVTVSPRYNEMRAVNSARHADAIVFTHVESPRSGNKVLRLSDAHGKGCYLEIAGRLAAGKTCSSSKASVINIITKP